MLVPWRSLKELHKHTSQCKKRAERKWRRLGAEEGRVTTSRAFRAYGITLEMVPFFNYLGRLISAADDDWPEVICNLTNARAVWRMMTSILSMEGARPRVSEFSSNPSSSRCYSLVQRSGWLPPAWYGSWGVSSNRWCGYWQGSSCEEGYTGSESTPRRRRKEQRRGLSQWRHTFGEVIIRPRSILLCDFIWKSVRRRRGSGGHGWGCVRRNNQELTWRVQGRQRRQRQRRTRMVCRSKRGGLTRKTPGAGEIVTVKK